MKRVLSCLIFASVFMFVGMISVGAAKIEKDSNNNYKFSWQNLTLSNNNNYNLSCSGASVVSGSTNVQVVVDGVVISSNPTGEVIIRPTISEGTISCKIYKVDEGNPTIDSASINIGKTQSQTSTNPPKSTTTTTTQATKSSNNNLKTLKIMGDDGNEVVLSPSFSSNVYTYEANVDSTVRTISIDATLEDEKANMVISNNANDELVAGENNRITITVTAEDGSKRAYTINIAREALTADATLKELIIREVKSFKLEDDKFTYNVKIKKGISELTLNYVLQDENATVEIEGNENLKDGSKIKITVTAEDGTKKVYTLNISVESDEKKRDTSSVEVEKNPLIIMGLSVIAFGLIGGIIYVIRK